MRISDWSSDVCSSDLVSPPSSSKASSPSAIAREVSERIETVAPGLASQKRAVMNDTAGMAAGITPNRSSPTRPVREPARRSEEHTAELQSLMRNSYAVFCLKKKNHINQTAALVINHLITLTILPDNTTGA